ncbi:hypothetical protein ACHAWF_016254 [Thalassiosira exigua]
MKSPVPNLACMAVLLSPSAMSSSFTAPARFGRLASVASAPSDLALLRGGGDATMEPPVATGASYSSALSSVGGGGDVESEAEGVGPGAPPPGLLRRLLPSFPWHELPNYLTYARCLSIPVFVALSYYPSEFPNRAPILSAIFAVASITDWFDGFLARRWDVASPFGAFLDPVADKLMVSTALIVLAGRYGGAVAIPASIILAREVGVSALREWMAQRGKRDSVKVGMQGKVKAALTMVSITLMLTVPEGTGLESVAWAKKALGPLGVGGAGAGVGGTGWSWMLGPSLLMLFASAIVTVTSGSVYFKAAWPVLMGKE